MPTRAVRSSIFRRISAATGEASSFTWPIVSPDSLLLAVWRAPPPSVYAPRRLRTDWKAHLVVGSADPDPGSGDGASRLSADAGRRMERCERDPLELHRDRKPQHGYRNEEAQTGLASQDHSGVALEGTLDHPHRIPGRQLLEAAKVAPDSWSARSWTSSPHKQRLVLHLEDAHQRGCSARRPAARPPRRGGTRTPERAAGARRTRARRAGSSSPAGVRRRGRRGEPDAWRETFPGGSACAPPPRGTPSTGSSSPF